jgi:hypothetical protein
MYTQSIILISENLDKSFSLENFFQIDKNFSVNNVATSMKKHAYLETKEKILTKQNGKIIYILGRSTQCTITLETENNIQYFTSSLPRNSPKYLVIIK